MSRRKRSSNPYRRPDARSIAAKKAGYAARSVFKLEEIDRRLGLFSAGQRVLDLGASPGSWSAYAAKHIGPAGRLLAIDLNPLRQVLGTNCEAVVGDALTTETAALARFAPYDVVLSDMAPSTTGHKNTDKLRSHELFTRALQVATELLAPGGSFVGKLFMSGLFPEARDAVRAHFETVRTIVPAGTRSVSYEVFLVGSNFLPPASP